MQGMGGEDRRTFLNTGFLGLVLDELLDLALVGLGHVADVDVFEAWGGRHCGRCCVTELWDKVGELSVSGICFVGEDGRDALAARNVRRCT